MVKLGRSALGASFFHDADENDDGKVDFDEFANNLPAHIRKHHDLKQIETWFNLIDTNGSGFIDLDEFFIWSLKAASKKSGQGLINVLKRYDPNGDGLGELEFQRMCTDMGFGDHAEELFFQLPLTVDQTVNYLEMLRMANNIDKNTPRQMMAFLSAMSLDKSNAEIDTSTWTFAAQDAVALRVEIADLLHDADARLSRFFVGVSGGVTFEQFVHVFEHKIGFGHATSRGVLREVFHGLADSEAQVIELDELDTWVRGCTMGKRARAEAVERLSLTSRICYSRSETNPWPYRPS